MVSKFTEANHPRRNSATFTTISMLSLYAEDQNEFTDDSEQWEMKEVVRNGKLICDSVFFEFSYIVIS